MKPAFSVIFLTTLIGAGQGLFLALFGAYMFKPTVDAAELQVSGSALALALCGLGLVASFFHLGHPERAWRSAAMWRTSWLSREVIALPLFMLGLCVYGLAQFLGWRSTPLIGAVAALLCLALFVCTAMVYMSIRFLQEWASPLTLANYVLFGCASGFTLATLLATLSESAWPLVQPNST
jgi:sulfite dehydrogenase (quinone) subunit SoeC